MQEQKNSNPPPDPLIIQLDELICSLSSQEQPKIHYQIEEFIILNAQHFNSKFIHTFYSKFPNRIIQYRYLLLGAALNMKSQEQLNITWNTFYEIINEVLKEDISERVSSNTEKQIIEFTMFLADKNLNFFNQFKKSSSIISQYQVMKKNIFRMKATYATRIFNSLLCLQSISLNQMLYLLKIMKQKVPNLDGSLPQISKKLTKKFTNFINQFLFEHVELIFILFFNISNIEFDENQFNTLCAVCKKTSFDNLLILIIQIVLTNRKIEKRHFLLRLCIQSLTLINDELFGEIVKVFGEESDEMIAEYLFQEIKKQVLKYITVSRVKSLLKELGQGKKERVKKIYRLMELIEYGVKKHNEENEKMMLGDQSVYYISNFKNAVSFMFVIDLHFTRPEKNKIVQIEFKEKSYSVVVIPDKEKKDSFEIRIYEGIEEKVKEKKKINPQYSIFCLVNLNKNKIHFLIDGAFYMCETSSTAINSLKFGPFHGILRDLNIFSLNIDICDLNKYYLENGRRIKKTLTLFEENQILYSHTLQLQGPKKKWFWEKNMEIKEINIKKIRDVSFGSAIEQLGGLESLFYLFQRTIYQEEKQIIFILQKFINVLKIVLIWAEDRFRLKWIKESPLYFSEFLWLIISRNSETSSAHSLFNRIFDFLGTFTSDEVCPQKQQVSIQYNLISKIFLNFQLWNKCEFPIVMTVLSILERQMKKTQLCLKMIKQNCYETLLTSLIVFFLDGFNEEQSLKIKKKILQLSIMLSNNETILLNSNHLKLNLMTSHALISSFFFKKRLIFSNEQLQSLTLLIDYFIQNHIKPSTMEQTQDFWIYILYHTSKLIYESPKQLNIVVRLMQLCIEIIQTGGFLKNGIIFVNKSCCRRKDHWVFTLKCVFRLANCRNHTQISEEVIKVLIKKVSQQVKELEEIEDASEDIVEELQNFSCSAFEVISKDQEFISILLKFKIESQIKIMSFLAKKILVQGFLPEAATILNSCIYNLQVYLFEAKKRNIDPSMIQALGYEFKLVQLSSIFDYCRSESSFKLLMKLNNFWITPSFEIPFNEKNWLESEKNYGGQIGDLLCLPNLTFEEILIFYKFYEQTLCELILKENQNGIFDNLVLYFIPIFFTSKSIDFLLQMSKKAPEREKYEKIIQIFMNSLKYGKFQSYFNLFYRCKGMKGKIEEAGKKIKAEKKIDLRQIGQKMVQSYKKSSQISSFGMLDSIRKIENHQNQFQFLNQNSKLLKKFNAQLTEVVLFIQSLIKAFRKTEEKSLIIEGGSKIIKNKKKSTRKQMQISDKNFYQSYSDELKERLAKISLKYKEKSEYKEEKWKQLIENNRFWSSTKIKNNQCYQIDDKFTGFYRLNIIKKQFQEVPYPRRKSFALENDTEEEESLKSINSSSVSFNIFVPEEQPEIERKKLDTERIPKNSHSFFCEYITQKGTYAGKLYLIENVQKAKFEPIYNYYLLFKCFGHKKLPDENYYQLSTKFHRVEDLEFRLKIRINKETEIFSRRYILRHTAIQVFSYHHAYFFNFFKKQRQDAFFEFMKERVTCIKDLRGEFERRNFTKKWQMGMYDNFEYLMLLNQYSGRTYNDLGQYPIMPWVLLNYGMNTVSEINLQQIKKKETLRDLSVPAGKISKEKFTKLKLRCAQIPKEEKEIRFLYGTMLSNPTVIYSYFIRFQPFTTLHWDHQGRKIDHADRLFSSIEEQFKTVLTSSSDNKELTPEFFYWAEFLKNRNQVDLGFKQNKEEVHDVRLPKWAQTPEQFVFKMREVLESPEVTKNLHQWIDLVFGYKNPYEVAEQYDNLFHYRTYEHDIFETEEDEHSIQSAQITISEFGQVPYNLFQNPHPEKKERGSIELDKVSTIKKSTQNKIVFFSISNKGMFLVSKNDVQFLPQSFDGGKSYSEGVGNCKVMSYLEHTWINLKDGMLSAYKKKTCLWKVKIDSEIFETVYNYVIYADKSEIKLLKIQQENQIFYIKSFYGHINNIKYIKSCEFLDLFLSVDEAGLTLVHEFYTGKLVRQFELGTDKVVQVCIHEMGYFIFLTADEKIIIYTFLGELFLEQDIKIPTKGDVEKITAMRIFSQNRSILLLATNQGNIYRIDFLRIKRFNTSFPFKTYSRISSNILKEVPKRSQIIKQFEIVLIPGQCSTYRVYALMEDGAIEYYYESSMVGKKLKSNNILNSLGFFKNRQK